MAFHFSSRGKGQLGAAGSHLESAEPSMPRSGSGSGSVSGSLKGVGGGGAGGGGRGASGRTGSGVHIKTGDLSTIWWACVWLGRLRLYRNMVDAHPKVNDCGETVFLFLLSFERTGFTCLSGSRLRKEGF